MLSLPSKKDTWAKVSGLWMGRARFTVIRPLLSSSNTPQGAESHLEFPAGSVLPARDRHRLGTQSCDTLLDPQDTRGPVSPQPPLVTLITCDGLEDEQLHGQEQAVQGPHAGGAVARLAG